VFASAIGVAIVTGGAVGHGDPNSVLTPNEQQFVNDLASIGVTSTAGDRALVALGYYFCSELSSGKTCEFMANRAYAEITWRWRWNATTAPSARWRRCAAVVVERCE
jgi:Protein of unknown function (DUF732)